MNGMNWRDFVDAVRGEGKQTPARKSGAGIEKALHVLLDKGPQKKGGYENTRAHFAGKKRKNISPPPGAPEGLEEEVEAESFDTHDTLETRIWTDEQIKPPVRERLIKIATDFMNSLPVEVKIEDIRLTGSLANYNWSNYSDVDLHIVVDFLGVDENRALVKSLFDNARMKWNDRHHIRMKGYDVEIYVEDSREQHLSSGVYSLMTDEWVKKPQKFRNNIDFLSARRKAQDVEFQVNIVDNLITTKKFKAAMRNVIRLKKKIKNMRRAGLESTMREFSIENIAFKILRRDGILDRLEKLKNKIYDDMMSVLE
jgi:predicted nucleotidyltransferase